MAFVAIAGEALGRNSGSLGADRGLAQLIQVPPHRLLPFFSGPAAPAFIHDNADIADPPVIGQKPFL